MILAPALIGGWFLFVAVASYSSWFGRPIALPQTSNSSPFMDDLVVFHSAGRYVPEIGGAVYDPETVSELQAGATGQEHGSVLVLPFFNPPSALLPLALFGLLPLKTAMLVWLSSDLLVTLACLRRLSRQAGLTSDARLLVVLGVTSSLPFYQTLLHGQITFLLLAGFSLFVIGAQRDRGQAQVFGGLLLLTLKPVFLVVPLLYLAMRREYRLLAAFIATEGLLVLISALLFSPALPFDYISMSWAALGWDEINGISTYGMFGWTGFWRGLVGPNAGMLQMMLATGSSFATITAFAWTFRHNRDPIHALAGVVLVSLLISPHSYAQDLLLLTIPLLLIAGVRPYQPTWALLSLGAWLAAYIHFDVLGSTGIGPGNVALVLLTLFVFQRAAARLPQVPLPEPQTSDAKRHLSRLCPLGAQSHD